MENTETGKQPLLLRIPEAAAALQVCPATIYNMIHARQIPHVRIRSVYRIPADALAAMVAAQTQEARAS